MTPDLTINPAFKSLIPPLRQEEYLLLRQSIDQEGCRDRIVVWNNTIIDGHNRYEICKALNVEFEIDDLEFSSEDEAKLWIINNQLGRRNLQPFQRIELVENKKDILLTKGKKKMSDAGKGLSTMNKPSHNTQKEIADEVGVSPATVGRAEVLMKEAPEEVKQELREGTKKIGQAYRELKEAIIALQKIQRHDPERRAALERVRLWIEQKI